MGREHGGYLRQMGLDMQQSHASRPLVEVGNYPQGRIGFPLDNALDDEGRGIGEHTGFVIVAIGMQRVNAIAPPHVGVQGVTVAIQGVESHQHGNGLAGNIPAPYPHAHALGQLGLPLPCSKRSTSLNERGRWLVFAPHIGTDENQVVFISLMESLGFGRQDGIDASYLIAHFPTSFKQ